VNENILDDDVKYTEFLKVQLKRAVDGSITVSKQNGKITHLTVTESLDTGISRVTGAALPQADAKRSDFSESGFVRLLSYINGVKYGAVVIKIKNSQIAGVEKNESIKL
jgi:hypothetical protein